MLKFGKVTDKVAMKRPMSNIAKKPKGRVKAIKLNKDTYKFSSIPVGSSLWVMDVDVPILKLQSRLTGSASRMKRLFNARFVVGRDPKDSKRLRIWRIK